MRRRAWMGLFSVILACFLCDAALAQDEGGETRGRGRRRREVIHPKVGEVVADFTLQDVKGKPVKLSDFRGKEIFVLELGACT